jgi:poly(3-hydroxybutyrate) depolymerase
VLDMDADFYLETIKVVFQEFSLATGSWDVKSVAGAMERVRPQDITQTAVFSVEGELDDITGIGQTSAVHAMCSGVPQAQHQHLEIKGAGHYGIFSGHRWHDVTYPALKSFILAHNG